MLLSIHENENALFGIDVVPFLATSLPESKRLWDAAKGEIGKALDAQGLMVLFAVPWPSQGIYAKKDLNSVADMKGLKWRAYNVGTTRIGQLVGAQSVTIQAAELPQALATGVVDSFMSSGATGYDSKVWESLTHFYDTQAWAAEQRHLREQGWPSPPSTRRRRTASSRPPPRPRPAAGRSPRRRPTGTSRSSPPRA